ALEAGIEMDYVRSMIRKHGLFPDRPPLDIAAWPWKIKVTTLGSFSVKIDGKPLQFKRKARQKPLLLLKTLIALGGSEVKEERLADILWPEAEGDKALQAVASNLHRLREMIGHDAIIRKQGRLSLNRSIFWCDDLALARLIENREAAKTNTSKSKAMTQIMSLYQGCFLMEESDLPEIVRFRHTINDRFQRCLREEGALLIAADRYEEAVTIHRKGLMIDGRAGIFLPGLMKCCHALGRIDEARMHYHRYKRYLKKDHGEEPPKEIQVLYNKLSAM
ncbi:MAG: BTAD domain-containing putative transcriptional regulator, partial [Nitrospiria bacterium]